MALVTVKFPKLKILELIHQGEMVHDDIEYIVVDTIVADVSNEAIFTEMIFTDPESDVLYQVGYWCSVGGELVTPFDKDGEEIETHIVEAYQKSVTAYRVKQT